MPRRLWPPALGLIYLAGICALGDLRPRNVLIGLLGVLDAYNLNTRRFLRVFWPFIATGALYDSMRYYLGAFTTGRIHVAGPYVLDRAWFGIGAHTLNEVFASHHWVIADLVAGFAYLIYVAEYLALTMLVFFAGHVARALSFARGFLIVNAMGFVTYLLYPAAPPWYVAAHGFGPAVADSAPSPAAASRFDALLGTHLFDDMYSRSVEVFGAIPSLHAAYPALAAILVFRTAELRRVRWPAAGYAAAMCFSAVYLQHHYVIDVLLGLGYAAIAAAVVLTWERRGAAAAA
ncbi:MAG TPA: phosphatase PAP2 family protein [Kofleriaceae bacterium]|nr:phosphatase PAP2 family protein [Kofleriaceae bacterium]